MTKAAAAGGITTGGYAAELPPVTTNTKAPCQARQRKGEKLMVNVGCYGGIVPAIPIREHLAKAGVLWFQGILTHSGIGTISGNLDEGTRPRRADPGLNSACPFVGPCGTRQLPSGSGGIGGDDHYFQ